VTMSINTNLGEPRDDFLARVRAALRRGHPIAPPPPPTPLPPSLEPARLVSPASTADLADLFAARAQAVGMRITRTTDADLSARLAALLTQLGIRSAATSLTPGPLADAVHAALRAADCAPIPRPAEPTLDHHYPADAGITDAHAAIAESGSIVLRSGPHHSRGTHLVPPIHIALLRATQILPDLLDLAPTLAAASSPLPSCTLIITGPSKTADIEGILVTGIHGPREVHILLIDE